MGRKEEVLSECLFASGWKRVRLRNLSGGLLLCLKIPLSFAIARHKEFYTHQSLNLIFVFLAHFDSSLDPNGTLEVKVLFIILSKQNRKF